MKKIRTARKTYSNPLGQRYMVDTPGIFGATSGFDTKAKAEAFAKRKNGKVRRVK